MFKIAVLCEKKVKSYLAKKNIFIIVTLLLTDVMTGVYTEDTLKSLTKPQIYFLKCRNTLTVC